MTIQINGSDYYLKYTIRALFIYEELTGTTFNPERLLNEYTLMYAILIANNEYFNIEFSEFIRLCDEDTKVFFSFRKWLVAEFKQQALLIGEVKEADTTKKKD